MKNEEAFLSQINSAVDSLRIHGTNAYSWRGVRHQILRRKLRASLTKEDMHACVVSAVERQLYEDFYRVGGIHTGTESLKVAAPHISPPWFLAKLSEANHGIDHFDPGWCVLSAENGNLVILKDGLRLTAKSSDCQSDEEIVQGVTVSLRTSKECFGMSPGFYLVTGSNPGTFQDASGPLVRMYWNVTATGAVSLVDRITRLLNDRPIGFRLKVLSDPSGYERCDAAVLYLSKADAVSVWETIMDVYERTRGHVKHGVPALTKPLALGLGLAEDPGGSTSFGLHRCNLIAEGLIRAAKTRNNNPEARLKYVIDRFTEEGIEVSSPYLGPGSVDDYPPFISRKKKSKTQGNSVYGSGDCLEAAIAIGRKIASTAVRSGRKCTWAGYIAAPSRTPNADRASVFGTIGPDLYAGDSGIAWFLAELYTATNDDAFAQCAVSALRGASQSARSLPRSLFSGWIGVAAAGAYCSNLLNEPELSRISLDLMNLLGDAGRPGSEPDLLNGEAGMIVGLLLQARLLKTDSLIEEAAGIGQNLIQNAEHLDGYSGCSWSSRKKQNHLNLTGLSHGTSGIALALSQLYGATGRSEFRDKALQGFAYEKGLFDPERGNWPDLRYVKKNSKGSLSQHQFPNFWCHGAPGIAISRLAGWRHLRENECLNEARRAFRSTYDWSLQAFQQDQGIGCLCHGLAGNAMILQYAEVLGEDVDAVRYKDLAKSVAGRVAFKVLKGERLFGDAVHDIDNAGLMIGLAGIGHFLLRSVSDPSRKLISPLWPE